MRRNFDILCNITFEVFLLVISRKEYTEQEFQIDELIIHPNHTSKYSMYNIALLKLRQPVIINRKVKIICLPDDDADIPVVSKLGQYCSSHIKHN